MHIALTTSNDHQKSAAVTVCKYSTQRTKQGSKATIANALTPVVSVIHHSSTN